MDFANALCTRFVKQGKLNFWLSPELSHQRQAIVLCRQCPVMTDCMTFALQQEVSCGVWGGRLFGGFLEGTERGRRQGKASRDQAVC